MVEITTQWKKLQDFISLLPAVTDFLPSNDCITITFYMLD